MSWTFPPSKSNAVSAIFYVENSSPEDLAKHRKELVSLLSSVLEEEEGGHIVRAIAERIRRMHNIEGLPAVIETVEDLTEESSMWETRVKKYEEKIRKKCLKEGLEKTAIKLIEKGMDNEFIHEVTGLSMTRIESLREKN